MFSKEKSPFDVDLRCNVNIEVHVAMRLGDLIRASGTEDKQLLALGYRLSNAMKNLVDSLDDRQWNKFSAYIEEQSSDETNYSQEDHYNEKARQAINEIPENYDRPRGLKNIVRSVISREEE